MYLPAWFVLHICRVAKRFAECIYQARFVLHICRVSKAVCWLYLSSQRTIYLLSIFWKTLGRKIHSEKFVFIECFRKFTWQVKSLPSVIKVHWTKRLFVECRNVHWQCSLSVFFEILGKDNSKHIIVLNKFKFKCFKLQSYITYLDV